MPEATGWICRRCGNCCRWEGHVLLEEADIARLAGGLGLDERDFVARFTRLASNRAQLSLAEGAGGACVFLEGSDCAVYDHRPRQCREFPRGWSVSGCPAGPP